MSALRAALDALSRGQAVIVPTETVYGLAVDARNPAAVDHLIALKGRPPEKPFSVAVHPDFDVSTLAEVTPLAERLMRAFWPGPLTLVLRARGVWHPSIAGQGTVGVRCPSDPVALQLLAYGPLALPSCNKSGQPPAESVQQGLAAFQGEVHVGLDGGSRTGGVPSTVLSLVDGVRVLRQGALTPADLGLPTAERSP